MTFFGFSGSNNLFSFSLRYLIFCGEFLAIIDSKNAISFLSGSVRWFLKTIVRFWPFLSITAINRPKTASSSLKLSNFWILTFDICGTKTKFWKSKGLCFGRDFLGRVRIGGFSSRGGGGASRDCWRILRIEGPRQLECVGFWGFWLTFFRRSYVGSIELDKILKINLDRKILAWG